MLYKKVFLQISQYSQENTCAESHFNKVAANTFSAEHLRVTASGITVLALFAILTTYKSL